LIKSCYIHIPFCKKICTYCDFCKFYYNDDWVKKYLKSLDNEINLKYKREKLNTLYIGGGTPSSLDIDLFEELLKICERFNLNDNYEYTIEFNPEDINEDKLSLCKKYGVNRISIGIESFNKDNLNYLGRNYLNFKDKINLVKKYFNNINVDLIYGLNIENLDILNEDLDNLLDLNVPHISCYSLIIENNTILNNKGTKEISEDLDYDMYKLINNRLKDYNHYEISNYAKDGYESRHNLTYWNNEEYYGFGVGASSYINNRRINNSKDILSYLNKEYRSNEEELTIEDKICYELILGFRKTKGINMNDFYKKYNKDILSLYNIKDLVKEDKLVIRDNYISINDKYLYIENEILSNFV
jgi:oxygen-independent coproporphyrinogen-3 oxidase